jgi:AsmA protein
MAKRGFATPSRKWASLAGGLLALSVLATAGVAALAPWAFSPVALRAEIAARIRDMTGLEADTSGAPVFVFLPRPHVSIDDVRFADPSGALRVSTSHLEGYVRIPALLLGRVEVTRVRLTRPELVIDMNGRPMPPHSAIGRAAAARSATPQARTTEAARLGAVELVDGTARVSRGSGAAGIRIDAINVTVDWPKLGAAAHVSGRLGWNGETAEIDALVGRPVDLIRGEPSWLALHLSAPVASLSFEGMLTSMPEARLTGRLAAAVPSAAKLVALVGAADPLPAPFDDLALHCNATISAASAECASLRLGFDGNVLDGTLALRASGDHAVLSGALATEVLALQPFLARWPALLGRDGQWNRVPFDLQPSRAPDLDLRLSAARVELGRFRLEDAQLGLVSDRERLEIHVPTAAASGGTVAGTVRLGFRAGAVGVRTHAEFARVDLAAAPRAAHGGWRIAGSMTGSADLEAEGSSMSELMRGLNGAADIALSSGEFSGIDLAGAFHRMKSRPLSLAGEMHRGATAFDTAHFAISIEKGIAEVETGRMHTALVDLAVAGTADIAERSLDLHAVATPTAEVSDPRSHAKPKLRFDVAGSFDTPLVRPDVRSLIRRSGAAAPLFRQSPEAANRQSPTREAVP